MILEKGQETGEAKAKTEEEKSMKMMENNRNAVDISMPYFDI